MKIHDHTVKPVRRATPCSLSFTDPAYLIDIALTDDSLTAMWVDLAERYIPERQKIGEKEKNNDR